MSIVATTEVVGPFVKRIRKSAWKVEIHLRELDTARTYYFASKGLAELGLAWAYQVHLASVKARLDASDIEEMPNPGNPEGKKLVWWQATPRGFIGMKDYFYLGRDTFRRDVIT